MSSEGTLKTLIPSMVEIIKEVCKAANKEYPNNRGQAIRIAVLGLMDVYKNTEVELLKDIVTAEFNHIETGEYSEKPFIGYGGIGKSD